MLDTLTIGTVAKRAGLRTSAIRYYESAGVLPPPQRESGQRRYAQDVFVRLAVIRAARKLDFSMAEIRALFHAFPDDTTLSDRWHALARLKIVEMNALIDRAESIRTMLTETLGCECATFDQCAMLAE